MAAESAHDPTNDRQGLFHWRPSTNKLLTSLSSCTPPVPPSRASTGANLRHGKMSTIPQELYEMITKHLSPIDLLCLDQTCRRFRLNALRRRGLTTVDRWHMYLLRARRDNFHLPSICVLEIGGHLNHDWAICGFCNTAHPRTKFTPEQLSVAPENRHCSLAARKVFLCGDYSASSIELREVHTQLCETYETSNGSVKTMHYTSPQGIYRAVTDFRSIIPLSRLVEPTHDLAPERTSFALWPNGLKFTHEIHDYDRLYRYWSRISASVVRQLSYSPICPHQTVLQADSGAKHAQPWLQQCHKAGCTTRFCLMSCSGTHERRWHEERYRCMRIEKPLGWIEVLKDDT